MPAHDHLGALTQLPNVHSAQERRALWRQGMATLARAAMEQQPVPLEGLDPQQLLEAVRVAAADQLLDDVGWLSAPAAAAAMYELAAAIPVGAERRTLGRQAALRLHEGDAQTFVVLATLLAAESKKALSGVPIRARIALALALPIGVPVSSDRLALALLSRADLRAEWLTARATGALPARKLAARLLERAAREGARRAAQGDLGSLRAFAESDVSGAFESLLSDREPLVWRHAAVARGLLAPSHPALQAQIESQLDPGLSPTEWRRAAVSLCASLAQRPQAMQRCKELLAGDLPRRDPGLPAAMMFGLPTAAEVEPEAAEALLGRIVRDAGLVGAEALVELRRERVGDFGAEAARRTRERLEQWLTAQPDGDDGQVALCEALIDELAPAAQRAPSLRDQLEAALFAFADEGPLPALQRARALFERAQAQLSELELAADADRAGRRLGFRALRELDLLLLQAPLLGELLAIGQGAKEPPPELPLSELLDRLGEWLLAAERAPLTLAALEHAGVRMQRMRALLRLVDAGAGPERAAATSAASGDERPDPRRGRAVRITSALFERIRADAPSPLRRVVCAALARGLDALLRDEQYELSDVVVAATDCARNAADQQVLAEASRLPDLQRCLRAYAALTAATAGAQPSGRSARVALDALGALAQSLPWASTLRVTALRGCLLRYTQELEATAAVASLSEAAQAEPSCLSRFERTLGSLAQLTSSARRRLSAEHTPELLGGAGAIAVLQANIERNVRGEGFDLREALGEVHDAIALELPPSVATATDLVLDRLRKLPRYRAAGALDSFAPPPPSEPALPQWLPSRRVLGGFHVVRALGAGALASVFVATRAQERHVHDATQFALKVPDYGAEGARLLSEEQFVALFRAQGPALLQLPAHPNLAKIVSFDGAVEPKPVLAMELVEGIGLARLLERRELSVDGALSLLIGIAEGLGQMHALGIAHLGLKPETVIVRPSDAKHGPGTPVLVDFGLAGKVLRKGCGAAWYSAPEVWSESSAATSPLPADVYGFSCLAYELLTGARLFEGGSERAVHHAHLAHDGYPPRLQALAQEPRLVELGQWLAGGLRQHPEQRVTIAQLRNALRDLAPGLRSSSWPLRAG